MLFERSPAGNFGNEGWLRRHMEHWKRKNLIKKKLKNEERHPIEIRLKYKVHQIGKKCMPSSNVLTNTISVKTVNVIIEFLLWVFQENIW